MKARSELYARVRAFFMHRDVLEVETPILSNSGATDPWLASIKASGVVSEDVSAELSGDASAERYGQNSESHEGYLQTSPEFAMKRLLASGSGAIFQICKCFRSGEESHRHNPEFTMLEWYRPGFSLEQLIEEIATLVGQALHLEGFSSIRYKQVFIEKLGVHPFRATDSELAELVALHTSYCGDPLDRMSALDLLLTTCIEPELGSGGLCFLTDYPAEQASLARTSEDEEGYKVAKRAELYFQGVELANAYDELTDASEQRARFKADNQQRKTLGLPEINIDEYLLHALEHGFPSCAGVALGLDRLLMLQLGMKDISEVLSFPINRA